MLTGGDTGSARCLGISPWVTPGNTGGGGDPGYAISGLAVPGPLGQFLQLPVAEHPTTLGNNPIALPNLLAHVPDAPRVALPRYLAICHRFREYCHPLAGKS